MKMRKIVSGIMLLLLLTVSISLMFKVQPVKAAAPLTISVVFANGLNTVTQTLGSNFTVSVDIANVPSSDPIGFYTVGIQWNPALLELQHNNTATDILGASTGSFSSADGWSFANVAADEIFLSEGLLDGIVGYNLAKNTYGSGTLFTMNFTCKAVGTSYINITAINGQYTYLTNYLGTISVNINTAINGQVQVPSIPPPPPPVFLTATLEVVFANGLNTIAQTLGSNFTVAVKIVNSPPISLYSIGIQWNSSALELQDNNTKLDVVNGSFMTGFAGPSTDGTQLDAGRLTDVAGYDLTGNSSGNGTLFTIAFHAKASYPPSNITVIQPNIISYLLLNNKRVNISEVINGQVQVYKITPIPPASTTVLAVVFPNGQSTINETGGSNFTVSVNIYNPSASVGYYRLAIEWNSSVLSLQHGTPADIVEGSWMQSFGWTMWFVTSINQTAGTIGAIESGLVSSESGNGVGASGNGTMFTIAFHAKASSGSTPVNITILDPNVTSYLLNSTLDGTVPIKTVINGQVTVPPIPDVAITNVEPSRTAIGQGFSINLTVTAANVGYGTETFKVTAYANATSISSENVTLMSGASANINFTWDTLSFAEGIYLVSAYAWPVPGEVNLANNRYTGSPVVITEVGDLGSRVGNTNVFGRFDGIINSVDLSLFLECYHGTAPAQWIYLAELGSRVEVSPGVYANEFFVYNGIVSSTDLSLFLHCYDGTGP
jgi:hypothetical protein